MERGNKVNLIREASKLIKVGGEIYIWDINKEVGKYQIIRSGSITIR